jgi:hypothetical protein
MSVNQAEPSAPASVDDEIAAVAFQLAELLYPPERETQGG